jgi:lipoprotein-anchoring transpeptidase ErfK/SrfK
MRPLALAALALAAAVPAAALSVGEPVAPGVIAAGVRIGGVDVSGQTAAQARLTVLGQVVAARLRPMLVTFRGRRFAIDPRAAGYSAEVDYAVAGALNFGRTQGVPPEGVDVPLRESVNHARVRALLTARAARLAVPAADAALSFSGGKPRVRKARIGARVDLAGAERLVSTALLSRRFASYALPAVRVLPAVTSIGSIVVIDRGSFRLHLYRGATEVRSYGVAVGQPAFPTPTGRYQIIMMQRNPTWFPPSSPWAAGLGPVPPGPGNPLGTRWMGTSAPGIGIHGTPADSSIGTRASHGCIRMHIRDAEDLYSRVRIGTPVVIV